jgi:hypothetical protein
MKRINPEMTVLEAMEIQKVTEEAMLTLVRRFEEATGLTVQDLRCSTNQPLDSQHPEIVRVRMEVEL